ncbi:MAG: T9SS type A sorting domain-containing protein [bacterium]
MHRGAARRPVGSGARDHARHRPPGRAAPRAYRLAPPADRFSLSIAPNPVVSTSLISFTLPSAAPTRVEVFDVLGRLCARLRGEPFAAGTHTLAWRPVDAAGRRLTSGVYAVRLTSGDRSQSRRVVLLR